MANVTIPSGFVKSVLQNGVGRYVCQLQRLTLKFCKSHGGSRGMREFIEQDLLEFARSNPGTVVYLKPRRHRSPTLNAEYLNGHTDYINCQNYSRDEVAKYIEYLRAKSGFPIIRFRKFWHTDSPSVQGVWTPFTHIDTDINVMSFPNESLSAARKLEPTATDLVRQARKERDSKFNLPNIVDEN